MRKWIALVEAAREPGKFWYHPDGDRVVGISDEHFDYLHDHPDEFGVTIPPRPTETGDEDEDINRWSDYRDGIEMAAYAKGWMKGYLADGELDLAYGNLSPAAVRAAVSFFTGMYDVRRVYFDHHHFEGRQIDVLARTGDPERARRA